MSDLYALLQVRRNATQKEIRSAFRRLALKFHPDKRRSDPNAFIEIKQAYEVLSDVTRRREYDATLPLEDTIAISGIQRLMMYWMALLYQMAMVNDVVINMSVSLSDVYYHRVKKIVVRVMRVESDGTRQLKPLPLYVSLLNYRHRYVFKGMGDESTLPFISRSDVVVHVKISAPDNIRVDELLSKYDLYVEVPISLHQYYLARHIELDIPDLLDLHGARVPFEQGDKVQILQEKGLPWIDEAESAVKRGNVYVCFKVTLPHINVSTLEQEYAAAFERVMARHFCP